MEFSRVTVRFLAWYLLIVSFLGATLQIWFFLISISVVPENTNLRFNLEDEYNHTGVIYIANTTTEIHINYGSCMFLKYSAFLYEISFPAVTSMCSTDSGFSKCFQQSCYQPCSERFSIPALLVTLLPSILLLRGSEVHNHYSCEFWYIIQVAALLLGCVKIVIVTLLDLWDSTTNTALVSIFLGLAQLWLVQNFVVVIRRSKGYLKKNKHMKFFTMKPLAPVPHPHNLGHYKAEAANTHKVEMKLISEHV